MDVTSVQNTSMKEEGPIVSTTNHPGEVLKAELELGRLLFLAGAPGQRVLDSVTFLNEKLQGGRLHVFLGFEAMVITLEDGAEHRVAMCDYPLPVSMNANAMVEISRYLHALPDGKDPSSVLHELGSLDLRHHVNTVLAFAAITFFTVIFGYFNQADAWGLLIIAIAVLVACVVRELVIGRGHGYYITVLATTLVATIAAALLSQVIPTETPLISLIIPCIFVIPGFQLINGGWEILRNHMHIGIPRLVVFLNVLAIMTVGLLAVLLIYAPGAEGPVLTFPFPWRLVIDTILGGLTAICICVLLNAPRQAMLLCFLCGAFGRLVRTEIVLAGGDVYLGVFCGTLVISVIALAFCSHWQLPVVLPLVAASLQFIPGYYIILTLQGMARIISMGQSVPYGIVATTISTGLLSLFIAVSIVMGTLLPLLIFSRDRRWY